MRVCLLASGSRGNAVFIESGSTRLLVDAGLSAKEMAARLAQLEVEAETVDALVVTHEHQDHCRGIGPFSRKFPLPVFIHPETEKKLDKLGRIDDLRHFDAGKAFTVGDIEILPFPITHDAVAPVGFVIDTPEGKVGVATDLGRMDRLVVNRLQECRVLVIEANHDRVMLRDGDYPWQLKDRISSNHGHLSNDDTEALLEELVWPGLEMVYLAHLSEENNCPDMVMDRFASYLKHQQVCSPLVEVARQHEVSFCFNTGLKRTREVNQSIDSLVDADQ